MRTSGEVAPPEAVTKGIIVFYAAKTLAFVGRHWEELRNLFGDRIPSGIVDVLPDIVQGHVDYCQSKVAAGSECLALFVDELTLDGLVVAV